MSETTPAELLSEIKALGRAAKLAADALPDEVQVNAIRDRLAMYAEDLGHAPMVAQSAELCDPGVTLLLERKADLELAAALFEDLREALELFVAGESPN